ARVILPPTKSTVGAMESEFGSQGNHQRDSSFNGRALAQDELQRRGHRVARFATRKDLIAAEGALESLEILAASSSFSADRELFVRMPRLRALVSPVTGVEGFDVSAATAHGILVANGQIAENSVSMAEATVLLILASLYDLHGTERCLRENLPRPPQVHARMLMGKKVGLIGFGKIGQAVAERLSVWGVRLAAYVRTTRPMPAYVAAQGLEEVLATSDVVIVAAALNPESRGMLDLDALRRMKPDVVFVNITRGGIVRDDSLAALAAERPAMRLALDVFDPEPLNENSPLRDLPNAILTPHMVGHTKESQARLPEAFCENLLAVAERRVPDYVVNPSVIETWLRKQPSIQL
ncbi:NAD(P)-dependent oxidoreductase, partial [Bosea sp. MMO-172]|uniref:NAD(P)-dependent oxidoreductase n=1 Tax=Bosea sp. MMO-172 TaxID=3127885 RepID=UPI003018BA37